MSDIDVEEAWEEAAKRDDAQGAIHPSGHVSAKAYRESGKKAATELLDLMAAHSLCAAPWTVLDYACGDGRVLLPVTQAADRVTQADGFDTSPTMCRARARKRKVYATDDVTRLLPQYDLVYALAVLIHHDHEAGRDILTELVQRTAPGGLLIFDIPVYDVGRTRANWTDVSVWTKPEFFDLVNALPVEIIEANTHKGAFTYSLVPRTMHVLRRL